MAGDLVARVVLIYCLVAGLWIYFSDQLLSALVSDPELLGRLATFKGWAFVLVTAALFYFTLQRHLRRWESELTGRIEAEEKVRQLSHAVEQSPVSVVITDTEGRIEYVNRKFTEVTGYTLEEVLGKNPRILKSGDLPVEEYQRLWAAISTGGTWSGEFHNRRKNGELFWEWATISPIHNGDGRLTHFLGVKEDITQRKSVAEALRASEERFRLLTENASDLITVLNNVGVIRFQSPSSERVMGYKPGDLMERNAFDFVHSEDAARVEVALQQGISDPSAPVTVEFRFRHKDGSWRVLQSIGRSIPNQASDGFIIVNSRDVTESRELEERLRQSQKMEAIGQLAGGVAHDFNNILAVIQLQVGLLQAAGKLEVNQKEFSSEISKAAERAASLTRQLLLFGRRQAMQPREIDLNECVLNITKMLRRILGEDVQLQFTLSPLPALVRADAGMLDQVLMNLAVNARDAMPDGGNLNIETAVVEFDEFTSKQCPPARPGNYVCLRVSDSGCGISPEVLPHIFEPFFTTKSVGKGTGLGLATVFGIVQQHGGWIDVRSDPNCGTTFFIYLPRLTDNKSLTVRKPEQTSLQRGSETILLVEDDAAVRTSVKGVLDGLGYRVIEAACGAEALQLWKTHGDGIDLLLTDLVMPGGMSGKDLGQHLLKDQPDLKVLYTSGYSNQIIGRDFLLHEGQNFLPKPYLSHQLAKAVRKCIDAA
jgi:two-component system, cell cycle sensor histidine kinase and response regulator CckA